MEVLEIAPQHSRKNRKPQGAPFVVLDVIVELSLAGTLPLSCERLSECIIRGSGVRKRAREERCRRQLRTSAEIPTSSR